MKGKLSLYNNYFVNLIFPALIFGSFTGILTSLFVTLFKLCAKYVILFSKSTYEFLGNHLYLIPVALFVAFGVAVVLALICKKEPSLRGGGIPTSIEALRGLSSFKWLRDLIGAFFLPLVSFTFGVPLGTEGPSVLIGTAAGGGSVSLLARKHTAWDKYAMTGGASAGFSVATGSPISGIMFAIEEVHGRISPMIIMVATISVTFSRITSELLDKITFLDIDISLFPDLPSVQSLMMKDIWIPILVATIVGALAVAFLYYYRAVYTFFNKLLAKLPHSVRIFTVIALTIILGVISFDFVSTGHDLIENIFTSSTLTIGMLLLILFVRSTLTLSASSNNMNGGIFIPIMALGAVLSAIIAKILISVGVDSSYYTVIIAIGITACISSMMKTPLTAIFFAIEAFDCAHNILFVILASIISFIITEIFRAKSINDNVLERRTQEKNNGAQVQKYDLYVTIKPGSFAIGKQIRDIFWPNTLKVLSVKRMETNNEVDRYGENDLREGDILHIRFSTTDIQRTNQDLYAIIGEQ